MARTGHGEARQNFGSKTETFSEVSNLVPPTDSANFALLLYSRPGALLPQKGTDGWSRRVSPV